MSYNITQPAPWRRCPESSAPWFLIDWHGDSIELTAETNMAPDEPYSPFLQLTITQHLAPVPPGQCIICALFALLVSAPLLQGSP